MTLPQHTLRKRKRVRPSDRTSQRVRVSGVYMTAAQVRAELDRVDSRMVALKRDLSALPANDELRESFSDFYDRWHRFYQDARGDWLAWGSNVDQAQAFDQELDTYRARYRQATGRAPTNPTTSRTVERLRPSDFASGAGKAAVAIGVLALLGVVAWGASR